MSQATLGIAVDHAKADAAAEALRRLADAANDAKVALLELGIALTADVILDEMDGGEPGELN